MKKSIDIPVKSHFQRINVAGLLINESKQLLLCRRSQNKKFKPGIWHIPGGKQENGETAEVALTREFKEELDLDITSIQPLNVVFEYAGSDGMHCTQFYLVTARGSISLDFENDAYAFVDLGNLSDYLDESLAASKEAFEKALIKLNLFSDRDRMIK